MQTAHIMNTSPLYQNVANSVADLIENGTFRTGDRVPSIRELSNQYNVSINTVKVAYSLLEDRCLIEARPQSGYYVRPRLPALPSEPDVKQHSVIPQDITSNNLVMGLMQDTLDHNKIQFGAAIPCPDLIPKQKLSRILATVTKRYIRESVDYAMPPGNKRLRSQISKRMFKAGCTLKPNDIVITTGAAEAVYLALSSLCKFGDTIAVSAPIYFNFVQMFKILGLRVLEIPSSPTIGIHLGSLQTALESNTVKACLVITNFNNPLGNCLSDDAKEHLVRLLAEHDVPLIEDDINGDLSFTDDRPSVAKAWDTSNNVLLCSSFSKTLAPGYRIGWIAPGKHLEKIMHLKLITNIASPSPTQLAVAEFLTTGGYEHHLRTIRKSYAQRTARMSEAIGEAFPTGTRITRPTGGYSLWVEMPESIDSIDLYTKANEQGITVAPGTVFSTSDNFNHCIRLNAAFWSEENRWAVDALGNIAFSLLK